MGFPRMLVTILTIILSRVSMTSAQAQPKCNLEGTVNVVLLKYPPYLVNANITIDALANGNFSGLKSTKLLNCFISQCRKRKLKIDWRVKTIQDEEALWDTLLDNNNTVDIIYPVPVEVYNNYLLEIDGDDSEYITKEETRRFVPVDGSNRQGHFVNIENCRTDLSKLIFTMIYKQWPIFTLMLLLASIAGIIVWLLESRDNKDEFAMSFFPGGFDGFWWAFISMTTVGYGDKTPRSLIGRLFSILWIFVGITIVSFFTATITSAITIATVKNSCERIENRTVAVLNQSKVISHVQDNGGEPKVYSYENIIQMFDDLDSIGNHIDSMLIDLKLAQFYIKEILERKHIKKVKAEGAKDVMFYVMMPYDNRTPSKTCFNVKYELDPVKFKPNTLQKIEYAVIEEEVVQPLSLKSPETWPVLYTLVVLTVGLFLLGVVQDLMVRIRRHRSKHSYETETCLEVIPSSSGSGAESSAIFYQTRHALGALTQEIREMKELMLNSMERLSTIERMAESKQKN